VFDTDADALADLAAESVGNGTKAKDADDADV
jgi:hypothetical protein